MENLKAIAIFPEIPPQNLDEFKRIAQELLQRVAEQDSVINYEMFFTLDNSRCVVIEEYKTPDGVIEHVNRNKALLEQLTSLGGKIEGSMFPRTLRGQAIEQIQNTWDSKMHIYFGGK